jgi:hypothetical protein
MLMWCWIAIACVPVSILVSACIAQGMHDDR